VRACVTSERVAGERWFSRAGCCWGVAVRSGDGWAGGCIDGGGVEGVGEGGGEDGSEGARRTLQPPSSTAAVSARVSLLSERCS